MSNMGNYGLIILTGILTAYEMRIEDSKPKEATFKVATKNQQDRKGQLSGDPEDVSGEEMENFVNKLPRGTGRYKGKLPLKCFNC